MHHRPAHQMRAGVTSLLDQRHRNLAEPLEQLLVLGKELHQPIGACEAAGTATDDGDPYLDALVLGVLETADELLLGLDRRRELDRGDTHDVLASPSSP